MEDFVNVSVRIRPPNETSSETCVQVISKQPAVLLVSEKSQTFHFDNIFSNDIAQADIYNDSVKRLVEKVKAGYNCTIFAYGQTGTGKTFTIGTNPAITDEDEVGLIARALEDFFSTSDEDNEVEIEISFIEIYNEKVFDLLAVDNKHPLTVKGFKVHGFERKTVNSKVEALQYLKLGGAKRHIGETKQNSSSSRSHAIFSIYCCTRNTERETLAKINLVDLAGSESVRKTGNQGSSFYEGININKGLLSLGQVMTALSSNSSHIPYRQSIITTILQDSLNKRNFISLIACVSSHPDDVGETLHTLEFANRVKKMRNRPEVNEFISQYRKENPSLFVGTQKSQTPMKRSNGYLYETPFKKPKTALPMIYEPIHSVNSSNLDITPLFSSSMTSGVSEHQQNLSPVIRKYMNAMESSLMNRLEGVIRNTLTRPKVSVSREDKENLMEPRTLRNRLDKDATPEVVIGDDSGQGRDLRNLSQSGGSPRNTSLSFQMIDLQTSTSQLLSGDNRLTTESENDFIFKVPDPKNGSAKTSNKRTRRSSVRRDLLDSAARRRSVRIQLKEQLAEGANDAANVSIMESTKLEHSTRRRSVRLQRKYESDSSSDVNPSRRRITRTPCVNCVSKSPIAKESPITSRTKYVLNVLNKGSLKEIEKLHTVGSKTAEKILFFRQVKGKFKAISDMAEMPYWTKKKFEKFVAENFLRV